MALPPLIIVYVSILGILVLLQVGALIYYVWTLCVAPLKNRLPSRIEAEQPRPNLLHYEHTPLETEYVNL